MNSNDILTIICRVAEVVPFPNLHPSTEEQPIKANANQGAIQDGLKSDLRLVSQSYVSSKRNDIFILALYTRPSTIIEILTPSMQNVDELLGNQYPSLVFFCPNASIFFARRTYLLPFLQAHKLE